MATAKGGLQFKDHLTPLPELFVVQCVITRVVITPPEVMVEHSSVYHIKHVVALVTFFQALKS